MADTWSKSVYAERTHFCLKNNNEVTLRDVNQITKSCHLWKWYLQGSFHFLHYVFLHHRLFCGSVIISRTMKALSFLINYGNYSIKVSEIFFLRIFCKLINNIFQGNFPNGKSPFF